MGRYIKKIKEILTGVYNYTTGNPETKQMALERASICAECPLNVNNKCSTQVVGTAVKTFVYNEELRHEGRLYKGCGCNLSLKAESPESKCPIGKF